MINVMPKVCILGATFNTGNQGVSMLAAGAIQCVLQRFPEARIIQVDYGYEGYSFDYLYNGENVPIEFVNLRFSKKVFLGNNIALLIVLALVSHIIPFQNARRWLLSRNQWLREVSDCDIAFAVSGGDSFSDIYGLGRFLYVALPQLLMLFMGKRLILLPQTIGPFRSKVVEMMAKYILRKAEMTYLRDHISRDLAKKLLGTRGGDKSRFCFDMAFVVEPVTPPSLNIAGFTDVKDVTPLVGLNISGLLLAGGYTRDNMFGLKVDYRTLIEELIQLLIERHSARVLLIPHVFARGASMEGDSGACESIFEALRTRYEGRLGVVRGNYKHNEIKHVIGSCDFFIGARMHACIGALSQHIPTVLIAYSDKFAGMAQAIGGGVVVDPRSMDASEIIAAVGKAYSGRQTLKAELEKRIPHVKTTVRDALKDLAWTNVLTVNP